MDFSLISPEDIDSLIRLLRQKGGRFLLPKLNWRSDSRIKSQWDHYEGSGSNWWDISAVTRRWNEKISGNPDCDYIQYVVEKYAADRNNLSLLSVGCGTGSQEREWAMFENFSRIEGIDISEKSISTARDLAAAHNLSITYQIADFAAKPLNLPAFDFILFHSSLHHFNDISGIIKEGVIPILKPDGYLIIFEYTGPNRFQYTKSQLEVANRCLGQLPPEWRLRKDKSLKNKVYRPGWLRMYLNDPSEAPHSMDILPVLRKELKCLEEKSIGGAVLHPLLKDIAHHFNQGNRNADTLLEQLFQEEDSFFRETGQSDFWFGVYQKG